MRLVVDNNILFSLMNPKSSASYLLFSLFAEFITPKFVLSEFAKYKEECERKSGLSDHEFGLRQSEVEEKVDFIPLSLYKSFLKKAIVALPDPNDSPYLALALATNSVIWSNDSYLRAQSFVSVYSTEELVGLLLKGEL